MQEKLRSLTDTDVREFLMSAREAAIRCDDARDLVQRLDAICRKVTPMMSDMPHGGGTDHGRESAWVALADAREELLARMQETADRQLLVGDFIDQVPGRPVHRAILRRRYLHCESWRDVEKWLKKHGEWYEQRQIFNLHGEALNNARILWSQIRDRQGPENTDETNGGWKE